MSEMTGPPDAFVENTVNERVLYEKILDVAERGLTSCYGTDPRHKLLAVSIAEEIVLGLPLPWSLARQFGQSIPYSEELRERAAGTQLEIHQWRNTEGS